MNNRLLTLLSTFMLCSLELGVATQSAYAEPMRFYCGTYTTRLGHVDGKAKAIGIYELDGQSDEIRSLGLSPPITNSSHLCASKDGTKLYVSSEVVEYEGKEDGYLTVFDVDSETGALTFRQRVSSSGPGPAYVHLDQSGKYLLLANYVAGNVVVYPIFPDGTLGEPTSKVEHRGSSINAARQEGPHPHSIVPSPDNRFVYVPDLGIDRIVAYRLDSETGRLEAASEFDAKTPPGSGPRHFVFGAGDQSEGGTFAYCSLELSSELAVYRVTEGKLTEVSRQSTLPEEFTGESTTAEVRVSADGRHVYVANRGHDSIAVFDLSKDPAKPKLVEIVKTAGRTPRNFGPSPDGNWLVVGNQDSHTLVTFRRDQASGRLKQVSEPVESPSPALIYFVEPQE
ncbi:MAG: lactonase family protein [Lacipirellulaceae bacterium]